MKTPSDDLFQLIHSLTPAERGYFKKFARRHADKENTYVNLFVAIEKQEVYNEKILGSAFKDLAVNKARLYELILQSLQTPEKAWTSVPAVIHKNIFYTMLLASKGLVSQAIKMVRKTIKLAETNNSFGQLAHLLNMENDLVTGQEAPHKYWDFAIRQHKRILDAQDKDRNIDRFLLEQKKVSYLLRCKAASRPYLHRIKEVDTGFLENPASSLSAHAEFHRLSTLYRWYQLIEDKEKLYTVARLNLALNERLHKKYFPYKSHVYAHALIEFIEASLQTNRLKGLMHKLQQLEQLDFSALKKLDYSLNHINLMQQVLWKQNDFKQGLHFSNAWSAKLKETNPQKIFLRDMLAIKVYHMLFQFINAEYRQAYLTAQEIFQMNKEIKNEVLVMDTAILCLLVQCEFENFTILADRARSFKRKYPLAGKPETRALNQLIHLLIHFTDPSSSALTDYLEAGHDAVLFSQFHLHDWVKSKTENKPLPDIIKEQARLKK